MRGVSLKRFIPFLMLVLSLGLTKAWSQPTVYIPFDATWQYFEIAGGPTNQTGLTWKDLAYVDDAVNGWKTGQGLFAFPAGEALPVPQVRLTTLTHGLQTYYFRKHFNNTLTPAQVTLTFTNVLDDAIAVYLNGDEIYRVNIPAGVPIDYTYGVAAATEALTTGYQVVIRADQGELRSGDNVLAVELHNTVAVSSDEVFGLHMQGTLAFGPVIVDATQPANTNVVQGRDASLIVVADGTPAPTYQWFFNASPAPDPNFTMLPNATNSTHTITNMMVANNGRYFARVSGAGPSVNSRTNTVSYTADDVGPVAIVAVWTSLSNLVVSFNEALNGDPTAGTSDAFSYDVSTTAPGVPDLTVGLAVVVNRTNVVLTLAQEQGIQTTRNPNVNYSLSINDQVADAQLNPSEGQVIDIDAPILSAFNAVWTFLQTGADLGTAWTNSIYDDSLWSSGPGVFAQDTVVAGRTDLTDLMSPNEGGPTTIYFRTHFNVLSLARIVSMSISYWYDDGVVGYLNGTEIFRNGVAAGQNFQTFATSHEASSVTGPIDIPLSAVVVGDNILAVELHNVDLTSSDSVWGADVRVVFGQPPTGPPLINPQPQSQTVAEYSSVTFTVNATGQQPITYQWQHNNVNILGATASSLTLSNVHPIANGGTYRVIASNGDAGSPTTSSSATLTITPDTVKPTLVLVLGRVNLDQVVLSFSEGLAQGSAEDTSHYVVELQAGGGALPISSAVLTNGTNVVLTTAPRSPVQYYKVTVNNVTDRAETANVILPNTMANLTVRSLVPNDQVWRYDQSGTDLGTAWIAPLYIDAAWPQGAAPLGLEPDANRPVINTPLTLTNAAGQTNITYYFRTHFTFLGDLASSSVQLRPSFDDAIIVYLNGVEQYRVGLANNPALFGDLGTGHESTIPYEGPFNIGNTNLQVGDNVLAVEVHQTTVGSSDIVMALVVEVLVAVPPVTLHIRLLASGDIEITWSDPTYILVESATAKPTPPATYTVVVGATSPYVTGHPGSTKFYQLRKP